MKPTVNFHGSDIEKVAKFYDLKEADIHNYSGNVNPLGLSSSLREKLIANIELVTSYPDPDYTLLKESIAHYTNSRSEHILLGNGSTELIAHYIDYVNPQKALIIGPTYSEYEKKIKTLNAEVNYFALKVEDDFQLSIDALLKECTADIDLLVLCNPNNPTGTLVDAKALYPLFDLCKTLDIYILIDETYMDFVEPHITSAITLTESYSNCIVLRGFSKFFSAPGLRLGYGITSDQNCHNHLEKQRHHWSINSLAAFAGKELMTDHAFIKTSIEFISHERNRITQLLNQEPDLKVFPTEANFFFVELLNKKHSSHELFDTLIRQGLMIRDTSSFPFLHGEYFRFCILTPDENNQLIKGIHEYLHTHQCPLL
jgi:threonine-phosphate decarboxylase